MLPKTNYARYSPVVPTWLASQIGAKVMGDYHLLLAHDVIKYPEEYRALYGAKENTIIMDNSLVELGHPIPARDMVEACKILPPDCLVLPDYLNEADKTVAASWQAAHEYSALLPHIPFMGVIQGLTLSECIGCATRLMQIPNVRNLSIPRVLTATLGTRVTLVDAIVEMFRDKIDILHLLGFSDNLVDDVCAAQMQGVDGIDSAVPARMGLQHIVLSMDHYVDPGPRGNYWDDEYQIGGLREDIIAGNFGKMRSWIAPTAEAV